MKTVFVSAMYTDLHGSIYGGRPGRSNWYQYGLESYAEMNLDIPIQTYTTPNIIEQGLLDYPHIDAIACNFEELPFHEEIMRVKGVNSEYNTGLLWTMRTPQIMYGKFHWIMDTIERLSMTDDDFIFWIDAGLPHVGIFPHSCSTVSANVPVTHKDAFKFDKVFNERLVEQLKVVTANKILTIGTTEPNGADYINDEIFALEATRFYHYVIGGLFGGKVKQVKQLCNTFNGIRDYLFERDILVSEEQILTKMVKFREDEYTQFEFGSWYHEDFYDQSYYKADLRSFYKIFTEDLGV